MDPRLYMLAGTSALLVLAVIATVVSLIRTLSRRRVKSAGPVAPQGEWTELPDSAPEAFDTSLEGLEVEVHVDSPSAALLVPLRTGTWMPAEPPAPAEKLPEASLDKRIASFPETEPSWARAVPALDAEASRIVPSAFGPEATAAAVPAWAGRAAPDHVETAPIFEAPAVNPPEEDIPLPAAPRVLSVPEVVPAEVSVPLVPPLDASEPEAAEESIPVSESEPEPQPEPEPEPKPEPEPELEPAPAPGPMPEPPPKLADPLVALDAEPVELEPSAEPEMPAIWSPPQITDVPLEPTPTPHPAQPDAVDDSPEPSVQSLLSWEDGTESAVVPQSEPPVVVAPAVVRPAVVVHEPRPEPDPEPVQKPRPHVPTHSRPRAIVRNTDPAAAHDSETTRLTPLATQTVGHDAGAREAAQELVMAAPVEMWFGEHRVGVKQGTKTYLQFRRYADTLFDDLKSADNT